MNGDSFSDLSVSDTDVSLVETICGYSDSDLDSDLDLMSILMSIPNKIHYRTESPANQIHNVLNIPEEQSSTRIVALTSSYNGLKFLRKTLLSIYRSGV